MDPTQGTAERLRRVSDRGRRLLAAALFVLVASFSAHILLNVASGSRLSGWTEGALFVTDAGFTALFLVLTFQHLGRLTRERARHSLTETLVEGFAAPLSIADAAQVAIARLVGSGVATAGLIAVTRGDGEGELVPVAAAGYPENWDAEPQSESSLPTRIELKREMAAADPWLYPLQPLLDTHPWVARVPIVRGDETLGVLLLAAPKPGLLRDELLLQNSAGLIAAALDHARLYQAAHERTRDLEEQNTRRQEFLYAITHELRSPLTSIQAFAELLSADRQLLNGSGDLLLTSLSRGVDRLNALVNDLLDLGRVEESGLRVSLGAVDVGEALRSSESILRPAFMARDQSLALGVPDAPLVATADARALEQVVLNLLSNANRFSPVGGSVELCARREGEAIRIEVIDSGPGVELADRVRIFEPFYRVRRNGAAEVPGSGLGLAVARRLVELQGGRIWVDPAAGGGSRFCVELPAAAATQSVSPGGTTDGGPPRPQPV